MGWAAGTVVMRGILAAVRKHTPATRYRVALYRDLIRVLEASDWDTQQECLGIDPLFDEALGHVHPDWAQDLPKQRYDEARSESFQGEPRRLSTGGTFYAPEGRCSYHAGYYQDRYANGDVFLGIRFEKARPKSWGSATTFVTFCAKHVPLNHVFRWDTQEVFPIVEFDSQFQETPVAVPLRRILPRHVAQPMYEHLWGSVEHMTIAMAESQDHIPMTEAHEDLVATASIDEIVQLLWGDPTFWAGAIAQIDFDSKAALAKRPTHAQRLASIEKARELAELRQVELAAIHAYRQTAHDLLWDALQEIGKLQGTVAYPTPEHVLEAVSKPEDGSDTFLTRLEEKMGVAGDEPVREGVEKLMQKLHDDLRALGPEPTLLD